MNATEKNLAAKGDLQLAFDVGHSSIGWAVLQSRTGDSPVSDIDLLGCGVVTFPADDCLAMDRRNKRRQRRNIRSRRQRIERMEKLLTQLDVIPKVELKKLHSQAKGHSKRDPHERRGASFPWLLAARILAARTEDEKKASLLTWPELWDVLRWYAHNRGYDENLRWSGDYTVDAFSLENKLKSEALGKIFEEVKKLEKSRNGDEQAPKEQAEDEENDADKLAQGYWLMGEYGFHTPTFAESVAKFLLGPERSVRPPKLPGGVGQVDKVKETFTEEEFRDKLFGFSEECRNNPKHLRNYFKGLKAAFPRRHIINENGKRILTGGTEWEVRKILQAHLNSPEGKAKCDKLFETVICGGIPEKRTDWRTYEKQFPSLYPSKSDIEQLKNLKISKGLLPEEKQHRKEQRKLLLDGKIILPKRYQGGLLFGQLVPRFENRIIAECPVTYSRKLPMLLRVISDETPYDEVELWQDEIKANDKLRQIDREIAHFKRKLSRLPPTASKEEKEHLAKKFAADLSKVPTKNNLAFLDYRWAMLLANIKIRKPDDTFPNGESLRPLAGEERRQIDTKAREKGVLIYERKEVKKKKGQVGDGTSPVKKPEFNEINELAELVHEVTGCGIQDTNLDGFFIPPDMREALKIVPVEKGVEAFRMVWRHLDDQMRRRFSIQLLNGAVFTAEIICSELRKLQRPDMASAIEANAKTKLMATAFTCKKLEGRARYHHNVLRQVWREVMRGEDPRKKVSDELFLNLWRMPKKHDGCLVISEGAQRFLDEKPLANQTNNHLVRQRIQVLTGNMQVHSDGTLRRENNGKTVARNSLLDDIINAPEFADGDERRIKRITIEVTRDLQEMSGKGNEEKKKIEGQKRAEHAEISRKLAKWLVDENGQRLKLNGQPIKVGKYIKKAWIAEDLADRGAANEGWRWRCPYTVAEGNNPILLEPKHLVFPLSNDGRLELEHIIPKSKRVANGMEALVLTLRAVNQMKGQRSGLQFVKECAGRQVPGLGRRVMTETEYRAFVDSLPIKGATKQDSQRRKKRKELLLTENWNEQEFIPRDLTNTAYVVKLAAEKLRARFRHLRNDAPPIIYIPGSITSAFRDKSWRMFRELAAVHPQVKAEMEKGDERFRFEFEGDSPKQRKETGKRIQALSFRLKRFFETFGKESFTEAEKATKTKELETLFEECGHQELLTKVLWLKCSFNLKQTMREITQLHHAVDAAALGLVTHYLVPPQCGSLDGTLAKYIIKGSLNDAERNEFRRIYYSLQLARNFWFQRERRLRFVGKGYEEQHDNREKFIAKCSEELRELIDKDAREPLAGDKRDHFERLVDELELPRLFYFDTKNRLHIRDLRSEIKNQLHAKLAEAIRGRIIQHIPADMSVMSVKENIKGYELLDAKWARLWQQQRDLNTNRPKIKEQPRVARDKLIGVGAKSGKLAAVKGVLEITENMAVAMVEQNADSAGAPPMLVIPLHAARKRLRDFQNATGHQKIVLIRKGSLVQFKSGLHSGAVWKVCGVDNPQKEGPQLKVAKTDTVSLQEEPQLNYKRITLRNRWRDIELLKPPLTGIAACPTTSLVSIPPTAP